MSKLKTVGYKFEDGKAEYIYRYGQRTFVGTATCHEEDKDFESKMIGLDLAETRAYLEYLRVRRDELVVRHQTLKGFYQYLTQDREFDVKSSYATKMRKEIEETYFELTECREAIRNIPKMMDAKITNRTLLYQKIREKRKAAASDVKGE